MNGISSTVLVSLATFTTSLISLDSSSFQTFSAMVTSKAFVYVALFLSLVTAISLNSSKMWTVKTSNTKNLDKSGFIILSQELAVPKTDEELSSICLILLILVSEIIPVSIRSNKEVWSIVFIFSSSSISKNLGFLSNN